MDGVSLQQYILMQPQSAHYANAEHSTHDLNGATNYSQPECSHIWWSVLRSHCRLTSVYQNRQQRITPILQAFTISVQDDKIVVEHTTPASGEVINCYSGKSASQLYRQIAADCPVFKLNTQCNDRIAKAELLCQQNKALSMSKRLIRNNNESVKPQNLICMHEN